eukprot:4296199-Alexandrium_andersonii.AAC.1
MPTLLTASSKGWSFRWQRKMLPEEHLGVQGVPAGDALPEVAKHFPVHAAVAAGRLSDAAIRHAAGNGMNVVCVGAVLAFAMSCLERVSPDSLDEVPCLLYTSDAADDM